MTEGEIYWSQFSMGLMKIMLSILTVVRDYPEASEDVNQLLSLLSEKLEERRIPDGPHKTVEDKAIEDSMQAGLDVARKAGYLGG